MWDQPYGYAHGPPLSCCPDQWWAGPAPNNNMLLMSYDWQPERPSIPPL